MNFKHFICTRYNLGLYTENYYKIPDPNGWMERREVLFVFLLSSLKSQTSPYFTFLVFIDNNTPLEYKQRLKWLISSFLSVNSFEIVEDAPANYFQNIKLTCDYVVTSRIDCDDFYLNKFVETVQQNLKPKEEVLDCLGYQVDLKDGAWYTSGRTKPNSPFITLCEKNKPKLNLVFDRPHTNMPDKFPARFIGDNPEYVQVIHSENIINKIIGTKLC